LAEERSATTTAPLPRPLTFDQLAPLSVERYGAWPSSVQTMAEPSAASATWPLSALPTGSALKPLQLLPPSVE
jgi:hypothetical protein